MIERLSRENQALQEQLAGVIEVAAAAESPKQGGPVGSDADGLLAHPDSLTVAAAFGDHLGALQPTAVLDAVSLMLGAAAGPVAVAANAVAIAAEADPDRASSKFGVVWSLRLADRLNRMRSVLDEAMNDVPLAQEARRATEGRGQ